MAWVAGPPCTGKSTTAWELYTSAIAAGRRIGVCIWVHGAPAVGKSAVAWAPFRQLIGNGGAAYLDVAQLAFVGGWWFPERSRPTT